MDETHVTLLRDFYDAINGDDVESAVRLCDPDVQVYLNPDVVAALPARGRKAVGQYLRAWFDSWDAYFARPDDFKQLGDQVVVMVQLRARGRGSRFDIEEEMADVFTFADGKIVELRLYVDPGVALHVAGITE
jgi:uncharacterized protein